jgi:hypothetical protein
LSLSIFRQSHIKHIENLPKCITVELSRNLPTCSIDFECSLLRSKPILSYACIHSTQNISEPELRSIKRGKQTIERERGECKGGLGSFRMRYRFAVFPSHSEPRLARQPTFVFTVHDTQVFWYLQDDSGGVTATYGAHIWRHFEQKVSHKPASYTQYLQSYVRIWIFLITNYIILMHLLSQKTN